MPNPVEKPSSQTPWLVQNLKMHSRDNLNLKKLEDVRHLLTSILRIRVCSFFKIFLFLARDRLHTASANIVFLFQFNDKGTFNLTLIVHNFPVNWIKYCVKRLLFQQRNEFWKLIVTEAAQSSKSISTSSSSRLRP